MIFFLLSGERKKETQRFLSYWLNSPRNLQG